MTQHRILAKAARVVRALDFFGAVLALWLVGKSFISSDWMMFVVGLVCLVISIASVVYQPVLLAAQALMPWASSRAQRRATKEAV